MPVESSIRFRPATARDYPAAIALLQAAALTTAGIPPDLDGYLVAEADHRLLALAGLERYEPHGFLRSVAVAAEARGKGIGRRLVTRVLEQAGRSGVSDVYLLTLTAESYFPRLGFERIPRDAVPEPVRASAEFRGACPETATVMHRSLAPPAEVAAS